MTKLSRSQVSVMAAERDEMVGQFRSRPLDAGPYPLLWIDALTQKVREGGRTVNVRLRPPQRNAAYILQRADKIS